MHVSFLLAIAAAFIFWPLQARPFFVLRPFLKAAMAVLLAIYCVVAPAAPILLMAAGFALSAAGDFLLDVPDDKGFLPGLFAFLAAHIAFTAYFIPFAGWSPWVCILIAAICAVYYFWLYPTLDSSLKLPVGLYSLVIAIMGMAAMTTTLSSIWVPIGAALFIASDIVLATEKFKFKFPLDKAINWGLYAAGQIFLAYGVVMAAS